MIDPARRRLIYATTAVVAIVWILLDQATKTWAVRALEGQVPNDLGPVILRVIRNQGGAFSLPIDLPYLFVGVTVIVLILVVRALPETDSVRLATAYGLVLGGAAGNAADRIFRESGAVVDMLDMDFAPVADFPVFNVADIGITVGALLVAILMFVSERQQRRKVEPAVLEEAEHAPPVIATGPIPTTAGDPTAAEAASSDAPTG